MSHPAFQYNLNRYFFFCIFRNPLFTFVIDFGKIQNFLRVPIDTIIKYLVILKCSSNFFFFYLFSWKNLTHLPKIWIHRKCNRTTNQINRLIFQLLIKGTNLWYKIFMWLSYHVTKKYICSSRNDQWKWLSSLPL